MADRKFDYFVVLAGMRTGSNLLEEQLAAMPGIACHGELFNPHFFGKPEVTEKWGLSMAARDADPVRVLAKMQEASEGLSGFRLFHDHFPRAIDHVLTDRRAAKIVLTRRPLDSYVSLKIARKTGQWWLGDMTSARAARVAFDAEEYAEFLNELAEFQHRITRALQVSGQTAFHLSYEDLSDSEVLAGLGQFIGSDGPPDPDKVRAKVQNPTPVEARLTNPHVAEEALNRIESPDIGRIAIYEPDRGPGLRFFRVCRTAPLIYMPIRGAGNDPVPDWLKLVDPEGALETGMTQKDLRRWKRQHPGHRSFTVLRHPLPRAYDAFCRFVLPPGIEGYAEERDAMAKRYHIPLPDSFPDPNYDIERHRTAFLSFLKFLKGNLGGQTSLRVDSTWATQTAMLHAIGQFVVPDRVVREEDLGTVLPALAREVGLTDHPVTETESDLPYPLEEVCTDEIEEACADAYRRDYVMFGFGSWRAG